MREKGLFKFPCSPNSDNSAEKGKAALSLLHVLISFNEFRQADYNLPAV
jgi:hypothetical protein